MTAESLPVELRRAIVRIARTPRLLVACDYDGTLAPIVPDPQSAAPLPEAVRALRSLAELAETTTAVISGRALRDLATLSRLSAEVHLVGSHGSEFDLEFVHSLDADARERHLRLTHELTRLAEGATGVQLEIKQASVAVHVRKATRTVADGVLAAVREGPARWAGVHVTEGKAVLELAVVRTDKGHALDVLRHQVGATTALFVGDDITDERAFARLRGPDVGVKVGDGDSLAGCRVADTSEVAVMLALLLEERRAWLHGKQAPPIERLTMLANERSLAMLTPDATLTWMCHPRPDSAALFADLLGGPSAGHFDIKPQHNGLPLGQRYLPGSMTVETRWSKLLVTDYLDHHTPDGRTDLVRVISGSTPVKVTFAPRPEFGQVPVHLTVADGGLRMVGNAEPIALRAPGLSWAISSDGLHDTAHAVVTPSTDRPVVLEMRCGTHDLSDDPLPELQRSRRSITHWKDWLGALSLPNVGTDMVARSALVLRGLCHTRTGAILAAATTSLPEELGGIRNWDYRYCWLRDAAMTAQALVSMGSFAEADGFLGWLQKVMQTVPGPERLHPLYSLSGAPLGPEAVIDTLPGYAGSRPVRVGNLAGQQVQLDVFGAIVDLIASLANARGALRDSEWLMVQAMTTAVARRWHEPDHGIWEQRQAPRHHVYSKVMCWVTIDRAITLADSHSRPADPAWPTLREAIATDVVTRGWNPTVGSFTAAYDGPDLDAASLHVGLAGLLDPTDERFHATVTAIEVELRQGATVYRYRRDDGLPGREGGFHLCTAWMIQAYLLTGRRTEAEQLFKQLIETAGPTGLLAEEYHPITEQSLGNVPQAYSHIGVIQCAQMLSM